MYIKSFQKSTTETNFEKMNFDNTLFQKTNSFPPYFNKDNPKEPPHDLEDISWEWSSPSQESAPVIFCLETSLHGMNQIVQPKRHIIERLFWMCAFLVSFVAVIGLIWQTVLDYKDVPIVTVLSPEPMTVDKIPFPALTICSVSSIKEAVFNRTIVEPYFRLKKSGVENSEKMDILLGKAFDARHACDIVRPFSSYVIKNATNYFDNLYNHVNSAIQGNKTAFDKSANPSVTLRELSPSCREMIMHCMWRGEIQDCDRLFQRIETGFGYCCAFNIVPMSLIKKNRSSEFENADDVKEWKDANLNYDNLLFTNETKSRKFPYRQNYAGRVGGMTFLLNPDLDDYRCPNLDSHGFMMDLSIPFDIPRMHHSGIALKPNAEIFVGVKPEIILPDASLWNFDLKTRKCYRAGEYDLPHYTVYTASNCQKECTAKLTMQLCNCTLHYMPKSHGNHLCLPHQYGCTHDVKKMIVKDGLDGLCKECLPTCTEIFYETQATSLQITEDIMEAISKKYHAWVNGTKNASIVHVYFDRDAVYPKLRMETVSLTQLIANCGGLLGVCLGASVLSLLEIFYYGTLRLCCKAYHTKCVEQAEENFRLVIVKSRKGKR